jgi:hypothetical protein
MHPSGWDVTTRRGNRACRFGGDIIITRSIFVIETRLNAIFLRREVEQTLIFGLENRKAVGGGGLHARVEPPELLADRRLVGLLRRRLAHRRRVGWRLRLARGLLAAVAGGKHRDCECDCSYKKEL